MGMPFAGYGRTGYDNVKGEYWSTWTDNMSTGVMVFSGRYDEANERYEFSGSYVNPMTKQIVSTRSVSTEPEEGMEMYELHNGQKI